MKFVKIKKIKKSFGKVYDITVSNNHNFFCNNFLIGNSDYRGELGVICENTADKSNFVIRLFRKLFGKTPVDPNSIILKDGERIAQGIIAKVSQANFVVTNKLDETERGTGGFGSTGK